MMELVISGFGYLVSGWGVVWEIPVVCACYVCVVLGCESAEEPLGIPA